MLDFAAVRVGFVTQLLWARYGPLWVRLVRDAEAEVLLATEDQVRTALLDPRVAAVEPVAFRLAAAQALSLQGSDLLVVPDLNPDPVDSAVVRPERGGGADPWIADFPDALHGALASLPPTIRVPTAGGREIEGTVVTALQNLLHDPHAVRRIWARRRAEAQPRRLAAVRWSRRAGERRTVGVLGQPWLLSDRLVERASDEGEHVVAQHRLDPRALREEAGRLPGAYALTDAETLGAARLFARRGSVDAVRFVVDRGSGADAWLADRARALIRKPFEVRSLQDVLAGEDPVDSLLVTPLD